MTDNEDASGYLMKALEGLTGAESEFANGRFNNCANRCYYACYQAAIAALLRHGVQSTGRRQWKHPFVQSEFAGQLINRRHLYATQLRSVLPELQVLRHTADYDVGPVVYGEAIRALGQARTLVNAIWNNGESQS